MTPPEPPPSLDLLHKGLHITRTEGVLHFDREVRMRALATATLRGLAGHALRKADPMAFDRCFKRSPGEDLPPTYMFEPMEWTGGRLQRHIAFRLLFFGDDPGLIHSFQQALWMAKGMPFGAGGARVSDVEWSETHCLAFSGAEVANTHESLRIVLVTPLQLRLSKINLKSDQLTAGHLIRAALIRINLLSRNFGNGLELPELPYFRDALGVRETNRHLQDIQPKRSSCTQDRDISLQGVVGSVDLHGLSRRLVDLLCAAQLLHIGRHTVEGCGMIKLCPVQQE